MSYKNRYLYDKELKFWKIKADLNNLLEYLKYIKVSDEYIEILLDKDCDPYLHYFNDCDYFFVCYSMKDNWGWGEQTDYSWFKKNNYEYQGEINVSTIRKKKLKKICG